jgi:uncharacterized protein
MESTVTKPFEPRITLVTLGVADVEVSRSFYERLGFTASTASQPSVCFMQLGGLVLSLYGRAALAEDARVLDPAQDLIGGFSGITLAHNCRTETDVDAALAHAVACGATLKKPAQKVFWGGYSGYFADPDGHLWEVAHNPFLPLGRRRLRSASVIHRNSRAQVCGCLVRKFN